MCNFSSDTACNLFRRMCALKKCNKTTGNLDQNHSSHSLCSSLLAPFGSDRKPDPSPAGSWPWTSCCPTHFGSVYWERGHKMLSAELPEQKNQKTLVCWLNLPPLEILYCSFKHKSTRELARFISNRTISLVVHKYLI